MGVLRPQEGLSVLNLGADQSQCSHLDQSGARAYRTTSGVASNSPNTVNPQGLRELSGKFGGLGSCIRRGGACQPRFAVSLIAFPLPDCLGLGIRLCCQPDAPCSQRARQAVRIRALVAVLLTKSI